jgi:hypothetical protein
MEIAQASGDRALIFALSHNTPEGLYNVRPGPTLERRHRDLSNRRLTERQMPRPIPPNMFVGASLDHFVRAHQN